MENERGTILVIDDVRETADMMVEILTAAIGRLLPTREGTRCDMSAAVPLATIVIIRSHADQGTNLLADWRRA